jgi:hypothetical protein
MLPGGISVARTLPIDGALLGDVLLQFRRDSTAPTLRWTLGARGTVEVDVCFASAGTGWTTAARLWNQSGRAVTAATMQLEAIAADEVRLTLEPNPAPAAAWGNHAEELLDLAHAAIDELAEELLWHAARTGLTQGS